MARIGLSWLEVYVVGDARYKPFIKAGRGVFGVEVDGAVIFTARRGR